MTISPGWQRSVATPGGYAWWYFDALTPAGDALVCIFFAGAVFSPEYAARLRRGERALPTEHAAVNLALYRGAGGGSASRQAAWVMSEYGAVAALGDDELAIGRSAIERMPDGSYHIRIRETTAPFMHRFGRPVAGTIRFAPAAAAFEEAAIATGGTTHAWQALAPRGDVEADFPELGFRLRGVGYHDRNHGDGRLEDAFARWGWARFHQGRRTTILYSFITRDGKRHALAAAAEADNDPVRPLPATPLGDGPERALPYGMRMPSSFALDPGPPSGSNLAIAPLRCEVTALLERAPFYARYRCRLRDGRSGAALGGPDGLGEYLDLDRFRSRWNQFLLRFKTHHR